MTKQMSCPVTWLFSKLLMLVNGGGGDKSFVPLCRDHHLSHLCGWRIQIAGLGRGLYYVCIIVKC